MKQEKKQVCPQTYAKLMFFFTHNHIPELFFLPRCTVHCITLLMSLHVKTGSSTKLLLKPCHLNVTVYCKPKWKTLVCVPLAKRDTREQAGLVERGAQRAAHPRWICSVSPGFTLSLRALPSSSVNQWDYKFSNRIHSNRVTILGLASQARPKKSHSSAYPRSHLSCPLQCDIAWPALESHPS